MQLKQFFKKFKIQFGLVTIILIAVFAVLLATDLILKACEVKYHWNFTVIPNLIWVQSDQKNTGAAFSFLSGTAGGRVFLIVLTCIMFLAVTVIFLFLPERFVVLKTALVMIAAGAMGNIADRIALGYVRDFVWMRIFFGNEACCNFADFWIVLGVILAVIDILFFNEWAMLPLTKGAKARVASREKRDEEREKVQQTDENAPKLTEEGAQPVEETAQPTEENVQPIENDLKPSKENNGADDSAQSTDDGENQS